jgi:hypothetical protein
MCSDILLEVELSEESDQGDIRGCWGSGCYMEEVRSGAIDINACTVRPDERSKLSRYRQHHVQSTQRAVGEGRWQAV